jgi:hypothetical protein
MLFERSSGERWTIFFHLEISYGMIEKGGAHLYGLLYRKESRVFKNIRSKRG